MIMKYLIPLFILLTSCRCTKSQGLLRGRGTQDTTSAVELVIILGQSNASGRGEVRRLGNTQYNYKGVSTGYPSTRTTQAQYDSLPSGIFIYAKPANTELTALALDNGEWQAYQAGVQGNCNWDLAAVPTYKVFGPELSLSQMIKDSTGREVFIIKCARGGTSLTPGIGSETPGDWNNTLRQVAADYFIKRGVRDLKVLRPGKRINLSAVIWWQGENDAGAGVTAVNYQTQFNSLKSYLDNAIGETIALRHGYYWNLVKLDFNQTTNEATINTAFDAIASAKSDCKVIDISAYPRKFDLSTAEAVPVTKNFTLNSAGGADNNHSSYLSYLACGELVFQQIKHYLY